MNRLGYTRYVAQGGDVGAIVSDAMGRQAPEGLHQGHPHRPAAAASIFLDALNVFLFFLNIFGRND